MCGWRTENGRARGRQRMVPVRSALGCEALALPSGRVDMDRVWATQCVRVGQLPPGDRRWATVSLPPNLPLKLWGQ